MTKAGYRADIDGLRAVAVVAVVLYHAGLGFSGGFVGVDVFFVISGFLITGLLLGELEAGEFSFVRFWERRARRILPALIVVMLAALAAAWFVFLPVDLAQLGEAAAAQAVFGANFYYRARTGYFDGAAEAKLLLHAWSLAVEEQYYFIVPVALWAIFKSVKARTHASILAIFGTCLILSLALSVVGVMRWPTATFYLLPTRAWEFLLGSMVALHPTRSSHHRVWHLDAVAAAGLVLILVPMLVYSGATPFPGLSAVPPTLGTAMLVWANGTSRNRIPTLAGRLLGSAPLVFVGLISYSLYLWHWPILALGRYVATSPLRLGDRLAFVAAGFACAILSWRLIETPFRARRIATSRAGIFIWTGAGSAAVLATGLLIMRMNGVPERLPERARAIASASADIAFIHETSPAEIRAGNLVSLGAASSEPPTVLVWGDSHAMAALPAIDSLLEEKGVSAVAVTRSSAAPVFHWYFPAAWSVRTEVDARDIALQAWLRQNHVTDVILCAFWGDYARKTSSMSPGPFSEALAATVRRFTADGIRTHILLDVPFASYNVPRALFRATTVGQKVPEIRLSAEANLDSLGAAEIDVLRQAGARVMNPKPAFFDAAGRLRVESDGVVIYRDEQHLSTSGALEMLLPFLRDSLLLSR